MACCPEGALGQLGTEGYVCKGKVEKVEDLELYVVGTGSKCIIWNYDIFGFDSGRTRYIFIVECFIILFHPSLLLSLPLSSIFPSLSPLLLCLETSLDIVSVKSISERREIHVFFPCLFYLPFPSLRLSSFHFL